MNLCSIFFNSLPTNPTKCLNTLKQFVGNGRGEGIKEEEAYKGSVEHTRFPIRPLFDKCFTTLCIYFHLEEYMIVTFQSLHIVVFIYFFEMFHELIKNLQFEKKGRCFKSYFFNKSWCM